MPSFAHADDIHDFPPMTKRLPVELARKLSSTLAEPRSRVNCTLMEASDTIVPICTQCLRASCALAYGRGPLRQRRCGVFGNAASTPRPLQIKQPALARVITRKSVRRAYLFEQRFGAKTFSGGQGHHVLDQHVQRRFERAARFDRACRYRGARCRRIDQLECGVGTHVTRS